MLPEAFDNKAAWPDAVVEVDGREIHVHRLLLGLRCEPLGKMLNGECRSFAGCGTLPSAAGCYCARWCTIHIICTCRLCLALCLFVACRAHVAAASCSSS